MVWPSFSDANILNIFSGGSLLPGHTVLLNNSCKASIKWTWGSKSFLPFPFLIFLQKSIFFSFLSQAAIPLPTYQNILQSIYPCNDSNYFNIGRIKRPEQWPCRADQQCRQTVPVPDVRRSAGGRQLPHPLLHQSCNTTFSADFSGGMFADFPAMKILKVLVKWRNQIKSFRIIELPHAMIIRSRYKTVNPTKLQNGTW